jgi:hypothetical protein
MGAVRCQFGSFPLDDQLFVLTGPEGPIPTSAMDRGRSRTASAAMIEHGVVPGAAA